MWIPYLEIQLFLSTLILSVFFLCFMVFGCMVFGFMVVFGVTFMFMFAQVSFSFVGIRVWIWCSCRSIRFAAIPIRFTAAIHRIAIHWSRDHRNYSTAITTITRSAIDMSRAKLTSQMKH